MSRHLEPILAYLQKNASKHATLDEAIKGCVTREFPTDLAMAAVVLHFRIPIEEAEERVITHPAWKRRSTAYFVEQVLRSKGLVWDQCRQCHTDWGVPEKLSVEDFVELCRLKDDIGGFQAFRALEEHPELNKCWAKSIGMHLAIRGTHCHNCLRELRAMGRTDCRSCGAFNYAFPPAYLKPRALAGETNPVRRLLRAVGRFFRGSSNRP